MLNNRKRLFFAFFQTIIGPCFLNLILIHREFYSLSDKRLKIIFKKKKFFSKTSKNLFLALKNASFLIFYGHDRAFILKNNPDL